jgi:putative ABC transport system substrate-binding protein
MRPLRALIKSVRPGHHKLTSRIEPAPRPVFDELGYGQCGEGNLRMLKRRSFLTLLGGAAAAWPLPARAQQPAMPIVGFLSANAPEASTTVVAAFRKGLSEIGYVEGRNVAIEYRWAHNEFGRLPELAADLVRRRVAVIAAPGSLPAPLAAKAATTTIPIVFHTGADPVKTGLVASFNRPGGNVTGVASMSLELLPKRLGLLHELLPGAARFAVLADPSVPSAGASTAELQAAAGAIGRQIEFFNASTNREIDTAFASLVQKRADGLLVNSNPLFFDRRVQIVTLAARHAVPAIYFYRDFAEVGGLMSYGTSLADMYRQVGIYAGRILKMLWGGSGRIYPSLH